MEKKENRDGLRLFLLVIAFVTISGCGSATLKPEIPINRPLIPAVIYVPKCVSNESGLWGVMGAADRAWGEGVCAALESALAARVSGANDQFKLAQAEPNVSKGFSDEGGLSRFFHAVDKKVERSFNIVPNAGVEKSMGAKYRVVLAQPTSYRVVNGNMSHVVADMWFEIVDIYSNKVILQTSLHPDGAGIKGAADLADRLVRGLEGPRCETLNGWSINGVLNDPMRNKCDTFALPSKE
ncbi:hypothetical protein [Rhodanobacter aciditrophus]|uniref:hypothetical protein n=1 Tax=Rhodanobacter aciditrophus TaxID=1623218 RepID=UPI003CF743B2